MAGLGVVGVSATTLPIVAAPTLADGLTELLHVATAVAVGRALGMGVTVWRDPAGEFIDAEADPEVPMGVIEYCTQAGVIDPWDDLETSWRATEARCALELLHQLTDADVVVTPTSARWL